eukprot:scaffold4282_cov140-Isochrysis_galbana.AAC.1
MRKHRMTREGGVMGSVASAPLHISPACSPHAAAALSPQNPPAGSLHTFPTRLWVVAAAAGREEGGGAMTLRARYAVYAGWCVTRAGGLGPPAAAAASRYCASATTGCTA